MKVEYKKIFDAAWYLQGWDETLKEKINDAVKDDLVNKKRHTFFLLGVRDLINDYLSHRGITYTNEFGEDVLNQAAAFFVEMGVTEDEFYNALLLDNAVAYSIYNKISFEDMAKKIKEGKLDLGELLAPIVDPDTVNDDLL